MRGMLHQEHAGAAGFEYLIVVFMFALTIWGVVQFTPLMDTIHDQVQTIVNYVTNNNVEDYPENELWM